MSLKSEDLQNSDQRTSIPLKLTVIVECDALITQSERFSRDLARLKTYLELATTSKINHQKSLGISWPTPGILSIQSTLLKLRTELWHMLEELTQ